MPSTIADTKARNGDKQLFRLESFREVLGAAGEQGHLLRYVRRAKANTDDILPLDHIHNRIGILGIVTTAIPRINSVEFG